MCADFFNRIDSVCCTPFAIANAIEETAIEDIKILTKISTSVKPLICFLFLI